MNIAPTSRENRKSVLSGGLLLALLLFSCVLPAPTSSGQNTNQDLPEGMQETMLVGDPLVDRKVESAVQTFSAWRARMKKEHFTSYLLTYTALLGAAAGGVYGFLAFRFGDAMAPYLRIRKRTVLLSVAVGFGLGVFVAVTQVPPDIKGKVSMLLLTIAVGVAITTLSALALFVIQRWRSIARARQAGRPLTTRLRAP